MIHENDLKAYPLPYHLEKGGLFLKDAAVLSGLGVIGRSNLLIQFCRACELACPVGT